MEFDVFSEIWDFAVRLFENPIVRVVSYVVSPVLAFLAFIWNRKDRREIITKSTELGRLETEVESAHASMREQQHELQIAAAEIDRRGEEIRKLEDDLRKITESSQALWKLRPAPSFDAYKCRLRDRHGARIVTIGNLKGGVGKTTIAANLAAYISETRKQPVLLIDLDYQGSLSNMLMLAIDQEEVTSNVDRLFDPGANLVTLERARVHLVPKLNRGWLVPANYTFAQIENQLLLKWLLKDDSPVDVRHRLANALLRPEVQGGYAAIIFDMPPRMTLGAVNALAASHWLLVPTMLDKLSAEAVPQFLTSVKAIKEDLKLEIDLAGIIGCMTRQNDLTGNEPRALELAREGGHVWKADTDYIILPTLPRRVAIGNAAGENVAYFMDDYDGTPLQNLFDPLFSEICKRIFRDA
jgi:chromosome partitioning protein